MPLLSFSQLSGQFRRDEAHSTYLLAKKFEIIALQWSFFRHITTVTIIHTHPRHRSVTQPEVVGTEGRKE